ncbi:DUF4097 family beta strand repeat-containing protein [Actinocrispum sp. NPDC049592]|uniref:DUF4097 family beta strand repeat-containing protein n=1 Tax=Actinocrispum sp. NPDC049592 TaxID=3154835 RepID=UPI00341DD9D2
MPTFDTPQPISVTLELGVVGLVRFVASDRTDTVVEVRPTDEHDESDVKAAAQVRAKFVNGALQIDGTRIRAFDFSRRTRSVDVTVELPTGSRVDADVQLGDFQCTGRLSQTRLKTPTGNVQVEQTGPLTLNTGAGHVTIDHVAGTAEIHTGSGKVSAGRIDGTATVKNSNGDIEVDAITGDARLRTSNGDISLDRAGAGVDARTANGTVRVGELVRGTVNLASGMGALEIGIAEGTAAWLDATTGFGHVRNDLEETASPRESDETVEVRAHTGYGDITIHRA